MTSKRIYLHALTPVHSGVGRAADIVDLPIAREKATGWPVIPGSSLKGTLRDLVGGSRADEMFGTQEKAGTVAVTDQRILLLPVRSFYGTFAWVTSPLVLGRFHRDSAAFGLSGFADGVPSVADTDAATAAGSEVASGGKVFLEDLDLTATAGADGPAQVLGADLGITDLGKRLCIVSDTIFSFLCETATEVNARVKLLDEQKTVQKGGLWWEEAVPAEAVFYGFAHAVRPGNALADLADASEANRTLSIGGDTTVGKGLCRWVVTP
jgi:CRISPR-associated protein Cmr4